MRSNKSDAALKTISRTSAIWWEAARVLITRVGDADLQVPTREATDRVVAFSATTGSTPTIAKKTTVGSAGVVRSTVKQDWTTCLRKDHFVTERDLAPEAAIREREVLIVRAEGTRKVESPVKLDSPDIAEVQSKMFCAITQQTAPEVVASPPGSLLGALAKHNKWRS